MVAAIYLCGSLLSAAGVVVFAKWVGNDPSRPPIHASVVVLAGVLWPLLLVGLVQLLVIAGLTMAVRAHVQPIPGAAATDTLRRRRGLPAENSAQLHVRVGLGSR